MNFLKLLDKNIEKWALLFFYTLLVVTMATEVVRREVFSYSSIWGEELVRYSFIYLAWLGAAAAVKDRTHIRINVLYHYVSDKSKAMLYIFGDLVMFIVALFALYWSFETVSVSWRFGSVSHGLHLSMVWFLLAVPIGFSLMAFRLIQSIIKDVKNLSSGKPVFEGEKMFD